MKKTSWGVETGNDANLNLHLLHVCSYVIIYSGCCIALGMRCVLYHDSLLGGMVIREVQ